MTKEQLVQYLRVCADLADAPKDGIAHVAIVPLRLAVELLEGAVEPTAPRVHAWDVEKREYLGSVPLPSTESHAPTMRDLCKCTDDPHTCPRASTSGWCTCGCHAENRTGD